MKGALSVNPLGGPHGLGIASAGDPCLCLTVWCACLDIGPADGHTRCIGRPWLISTGGAQMTEPGFSPPTDARWGRIAAFRDNYSRSTRPKSPKVPKDGQGRRWFGLKRRRK